MPYIGQVLLIIGQVLLNSNADPGGASANEEPGNQESVNIAHGEEPKTHTQAMASPDTAEWLAAEHYELDQLA
jgi:hypothetical protein